jgi:hypothetical protein
LFGQGKGIAISAIVGYHTKEFITCTLAIMLKITDPTGHIQETIPLEMAKVVGVWRDMIDSNHSKDDDEAVPKSNWNQGLLTHRYVCTMIRSF